MTLEEMKKLSGFEVFCYFITERESIRLKKEKGKPPPWTANPILQSYRFCNVRRADDKVSKWLITNWYTPYFDHPSMLCAVSLARFTNKIETLDAITRFVFQEGHKPAWGSIIRTLRAMKNKGTIFSAAYMIRAGKADKDKLDSVINKYVRPLEKHPPEIDPQSMERTHAALSTCYGFGSFMAGQVTADLRHAISGEWSDKHTWAPVGPGSARGLARVLHGCGWPSVADEFKRDQERFLLSLQATVRSVKKIVPKRFTKRLEMHDYQNVCCEVDKILRVLNGEGRPKQRYNGRG